MRIPCPVVGFAAVSGTGKTTLLLKLLPLLKSRGLRVGMIKRAHHTFDTDKPGKDSYELRKAGATKVIVGSDHRWALVVENEVPRQPRLVDLLRNLRADGLDLVLVEGFKSAPIPKIEIHRSCLGRPLLAPDDPNIVAVATDAGDLGPVGVPVLDLNRSGEIAEFLVGRFLVPRMRSANADPCILSGERRHRAVVSGDA